MGKRREERRGDDMREGGGGEEPLCSYKRVTVLRNVILMMLRNEMKDQYSMYNKQDRYTASIDRQAIGNSDLDTVSEE